MSRPGPKPRGTPAGIITVRRTTEERERWDARAARETGGDLAALVRQLLDAPPADREVVELRAEVARLRAALEDPAELSRRLSALLGPAAPRR